MSKGKYAARAAKRQAEQATESGAALKQKLDSERAAWRQERAELLSEIQRLRNKTRSDIDKAAAEDVAALREVSQAGLVELRAENEKRAVDALNVLMDRHPNTPRRTVLDMAEALGVSAYEALPGFREGNRHARRRTTNRQIRFLNSFLEDIDKSGRGSSGLLKDSGRGAGDHS